MKIALLAWEICDVFILCLTKFLNNWSDDDTMNYKMTCKPYIGLVMLS